MIQKLLSKSNDECIFGITFKKLSEIFIELSTSSIFLYQKTLIPFQIEEDFNLPKDIPNEQTILNSLSLNDSPKTPNSDIELVWNYNSLYDQQNHSKQQQQKVKEEEEEKKIESNKNETIKEEKVEVKVEIPTVKSDELKEEKKTRWTKPFNKWDSNNTKKRGTGNTNRGGGNRGGRGRGGNNPQDRSNETNTSSSRFFKAL